MIGKIVVLFLVVMAVLAMFGKLRAPKLPGREKFGKLAPKRCRACGRYQIGKGPCPCGKER